MISKQLLCWRVTTVVKRDAGSTRYEYWYDTLVDLVKVRVVTRTTTELSRFLLQVLMNDMSS